MRHQQVGPARAGLEPPRSAAIHRVTNACSAAATNFDDPRDAVIGLAGSSPAQPTELRQARPSIRVGRGIIYNLEIDNPSVLNDIRGSSFNAITLWHVLEHVHQLHDYIEHLKRILKPQGKLFIAVPNYQSTDSNIYRSYWAAYDVPRHLYHFSPNSIEVLMQKHGLKVDAKKPMWFDSFYISMLSSKYKTGKTNYITAFINGLRSNVNALLNKESCSSLIYIISKA